MLVMMAGTMTIARAGAGGIDTASRPIATVGSPRPITPLTKPARKNTAAMAIRRGSTMTGTLTEWRVRHNLEVTQGAFSYDEGRDLSESPCNSIWSIWAC